MAKAHAHRLLADTAKGIAAEMFEIVMKDNAVFDAWKAKYPGLTTELLRRRFVAKYWPDHLEAARTALALLLRKIDGDEAKKELIVEALVLDQRFRVGRMRAWPGAKPSIN